MIDISLGSTKVGGKMKKNIKTMAMALAGIVVMFGMSGCINMRSSNLLPNTKFAYPNSNVEPIGPVSASQTDLCMVIIPLPSYNSGAVMLNLADQASKQKGGDLLIDAVATTGVQTYLNLIGVCQIDVAGTAAKMTVGMQQLK